MENVKVTGYAKLPYALREGHTVSEWLLAALIAGISKKATMKASLSKLASKISRAKSTTWGALERLEKDGLISRARCGAGERRNSIYTYKGSEITRGYFRFDFFLLSEKFDFVDKKTKKLLANRSLTVSEALIVALIASYKDGYKGNASSIARTLDISLKTVRRALKALIEQAEWIYCPKKAVNAYVTSEYHVNGQRIRALRKAYRSEKETLEVVYKTSEQKAEEARVRRELKEAAAAERKTAEYERFEKTLKASPEYVSAKKACDAALSTWLQEARKDPNGPKAEAYGAEYGRLSDRLKRIVGRLKREYDAAKGVST